jgi:hypothetical protein
MAIKAGRMFKAHRLILSSIGHPLVVFGKRLEGHNLTWEGKMNE